MKNFVTDRFITGQSLGASFNSAAFPCEAIWAPFIQCVVTGATALDVDLKVQVTSDINPGNSQPQNWVDLSELTTKELTADGISYWYLPQAAMSQKFLRIVGTRNAGTGSLDVIISGVR